MIRMIDRALLLVLLAVLAGLAAHILSLTVGAVLTMSMTPVADSLDHVLRITAIGRRG